MSKKINKYLSKNFMTYVMNMNTDELMCPQGFKQVEMNPSRKGLTIDMNMNLENITQGGNK